MCCVIWVKEGPERNIKNLPQRRVVFQEASSSVDEDGARCGQKTTPSPLHAATLDSEMP
jgi:hypothetical protein